MEIIFKKKNFLKEQQLEFLEIHEYSKVIIKLRDTQVKKLKGTVKNKTGTTLRMSLRMLDGKDPPHGLLLITRQKAKLRNSFNNKMSIDKKLSKAKFLK